MTCRSIPADTKESKLDWTPLQPDSVDILHIPPVWYTFASNLKNTVIQKCQYNHTDKFSNVSPSLGQWVEGCLTGIVHVSMCSQKSNCLPQGNA